MNNKPNSQINSNRRDADDSTTEISKKLRALYESVQNEEIPDKFLDLLERLDAVEQAEDGNDGK